VDQKMIDQLGETAMSGPTNAQLAEVMALGEELVRVRAEITRREEEMKPLRARELILSQDIIPTTLMAFGGTGFRLKDGSGVEARKGLKASIPAARSAEALRWLRDNGYGDLIKNNVTASYGRGEDDRADALARALIDQGVVVDRKEGVHWQTLSGFCREKLEAGVELPHDLLGIVEYWNTKITPPA
jgi:hypothetical protein